MSKREADLLVAIQNRLLTDQAATIARGLSHFGEHDLGWLAIAAVGVGVDKQRRRKWLAMGAGTFLAHAASVVLKRIVRRQRPHDARITVGVSTPSRLSFPSSHSTSTAAAMVHLADIFGSKLPYVGIPVMMTSRMVLGVHYPTDTLIGSLIGAGVAKTAIELEKETR
ncbi:phosphatase PAP2 family protein [Corynebacterium liangguodongii]|uniref:Phosphatase PAP2 family protein n=1 Tax=Corynebacterium liangguodongii TaxID=2079535 RepID=A0A2S0WGD0_9CORY|nr:phosphatase PAP2 family protein [Corynebacterium liangguodongii]AWB84848.1 phosphatase PAP2 family protein [Corynebacterium liangguodongii]PWB99205.1 PAP2 family protein [Corynebacterium liangguodongii]